MNLREYQEKSKRTLNNDLTEEQLISNMAMGISGEFGEVIDVIKKNLYQGHELEVPNLVEEIGDAMWYVANLCNLCNIDLELVLENNYHKLIQRYPDGFSEQDSINREGY